MQRAVVFLCVLILTGCHVSSRVALGGQGGRNAYNTSLQVTSSEQMLLNLVRLRYCDIPYFLDVSTITTQFTFGASANPIIPIPGFNNTNPFTLGSNFSWQNQPTIQYLPLEGQAFARQLMQPISLNTLQRLIFAGWDIDRVFRLAIQNLSDIDNASLVSGPIPDSKIPEYKDFQKLTRLLRHFQLAGALHLGVSDIQEVSKTHPEIQKSGKSQENTEAKNADVTPETANPKSETHLCATRMQIIFPDGSPESDELANLLSESQHSFGKYVLNTQLGFNRDIENKDVEIGIIPRSILGCMYFLSLSVEVPEKDLKNGSVIVVRDQNNEAFDWQKLLKDLMLIKHSKNFPVNAYVGVQYKDYWFYIDNRDVNSKRTFVLLQQLYNLQATDVKTPPPLLSIPLGL